MGLTEHEWSIIISSTNHTFTQFDKVGELFSYHFFKHISDRKTIKEAFEEASTSTNINDMMALLDDNDDGVGHAIPLSDTGDGLLAASKCICTGTIEKTSDLSTRRSQRAQSLSVFQTLLGFSNASAYSARSAVKLGCIVISLEKSIVPCTPGNVHSYHTWIPAIRLEGV